MEPILAYKTNKQCIQEWSLKKHPPPNHPNIAPELIWPIAITLDELNTMIIQPRDKIFQIHTIGRIASKQNEWKWTNQNSFIDTLGYLWWTRGKCSYVCLIPNEVALFVPFINPIFQNQWSSKTLQLFKQGQKKFKHQESLLSDVRQWNTVGCLLANEFPIQVRGGGWGIFLNLFLEYSKTITQPVDFFFHRYDHPLATLNGAEPYYYFTDGKFNVPVPGIPTPLRPLQWYPIYGNASGDLYVEHPIPTSDEWQLITQQFNPPECKNSYLDAFDTIPWNQRKSTAIWRGGINNCGFEPPYNQRLHLAVLSHQLNDSSLLDAQITGWGTRMKYVLTSKGPQLDKPNIKKWIKQGIRKLEKQTSRKEQCSYKYIIDLPGNNENPGYRFAWELLAGFTILWVGEPIGCPSGEGPRRLNLWFWQYLKPWEHYVPVRWDLSNLVEMIEWCQKNDKKAQKIAEQGQALAKTLFTKDSVLKQINAGLRNRIL